VRKVEPSLRVKRDGVIFEKRYHITVFSIPFSNWRDAPKILQQLARIEYIFQPLPFKSFKNQ
jgi:hypothetical protein